MCSSLVRLLGKIDVCMPGAFFDVMEREDEPTSRTMVARPSEHHQTMGEPIGPGEAMGSKFAPSGSNLQLISKLGKLSNACLRCNSEHKKKGRWHEKP
jgi:hypothetical protein